MSRNALRSQLCDEHVVLRRAEAEANGDAAVKAKGAVVTIVYHSCTPLMLFQTAGTQQYALKKYADATLGSGNLRQAVKLPEGEDLSEWLAVNTLDFFNQINMLYGTITEFCSAQECPVMSAGPRYEYHWQDGKTFKKPVKLSAPDYVDQLMNWVQEQLDDEEVFPSKIGVPFPKNFRDTVKNIVRRLFRVYAHLYNHHFAQLCALSIEAHINTSYKHFLLFVDEFDLIDAKELAPLAELNEPILKEAAL